MNTNLKVSKVTFEALKNIQPQSSMSVTPVENMGITASDAPYLPRIVSVGDKSLDDLAVETAKATGDSFEACRFWWNSMIEQVAAILTEGIYTEVNFGYWSFALAVEGSVPSADAQPTTLANPVYIACYPSPALNRVTEQLETKRNISAQAFIVDTVFGFDTAKSRIVTAGEDMHIFGRKLSMGGAGEKAELVKGENVYTLTWKNDSVDLPTRMNFTIPANVPAGKNYTLRVTAYGAERGDGAELEIVEKENITVNAATTPTGPTISKVETTGLNDDEINQEKPSVIRGSGFGNASDGKQVGLQLWENGVMVDSSLTTEAIDEWTDEAISTNEEMGLWPYNASLPDGRWTAEGADTRLVLLASDEPGAEVLASHAVKLIA